MEAVYGRQQQSALIAKNPRAFILTAVLITVAPVLYIQARESQIPGAFELCLLAFIQLVPLAYAITDFRFNYLAFIFLSHFVSGPLVMINKMVAIETSVIPKWDIIAMQEQIKCSLIIAAAYYLMRNIAFRGYFARVKYELLTMTMRQQWIVVAYVMAFPLMIPFLPAGVIILHFALANADAVLLYSSIVRGNERVSSMMRYLGIVSTLVYFLISGHLTLLGTFCAFFFVSACIKGDMRQLVIVLLLTVAASSLQSVKAAYRIYIMDTREPNLVNRLMVLKDLMYVHYFEGVDLDASVSTEEKDGVLSGFNRAGDNSLALVMEKTPSEVPFWNGATYESIPFMFIPRALWPDKPSRHFWNKFGRTYKVLSDDDYNTSVAVGFLAEGYMNYGYTGLYVVAFIFGIFACLCERLSFYILNGSFLFTFLIFLVPLLQLSSDFGSMLNSVVIIVCVTLAARSFLLPMAKRDAYGTAY